MKGCKELLICPIRYAERPVWDSVDEDNWVTVKSSVKYEVFRQAGYWIRDSIIRQTWRYYEEL